ncbi:hypothetical protein HMPREF0262_01348 [Clostridium sp. ATCC 29733]|nr:hypothetical protein HMPREF0262_01348 [Clostridium sp. ATCC 29733]
MWPFLPAIEWGSGPSTDRGPPCRSGSGWRESFPPGRRFSIGPRRWAPLRQKERVQSGSRGSGTGRFAGGGDSKKRGEGESSCCSPPRPFGKVPTFA